MRALIQRVSEASVAVDGKVIGSIASGLVVLVGISKEDDDEDVRYITGKVLNLRIFPDQEGRFDGSVLEVRGELLVVSQFTLYADTRRGRRPSFSDAAPQQYAEALFLKTIGMFKNSGLKVETGRFQARMLVSLCNDGPVTVLIDSADRQHPRRG